MMVFCFKGLQICFIADRFSLPDKSFIQVPPFSGYLKNVQNPFVTGRFNEDGSFIGQYGTLRKQQQLQRQQQQQQQQQQQGVPVVVTNSTAFATAKAAASVSPGTYV